MAASGVDGLQRVSIMLALLIGRFPPQTEAQFTCPLRHLIDYAFTNLFLQKKTTV
jgi:hypothetical protein